MGSLAIGVPVMKNFKGFTELIESVDEPFFPIVYRNWEENRGVSKAWNYALDIARFNQCDFLLITNDDVVLHRRTLRKLQTDLVRAGSVPFITACATAGLDGYSETPDFACFMVRPQEFVERYGYFDENFSPAYFEDNDMAHRIKLAGDRYLCNLSATIEHKGSVTQNMDGPVVDSLRFEANRAYYVQKWGGVPMQEAYSHPFNANELDLRYWPENDRK